MSAKHSLYDIEAVTTLVALLRLRAQQQPEQLAYRFLVDGDTHEVSLTYSDLDKQARALAAQLQQEGNAGDPVLLLYPPGLAYVAAFFGCLYAGMIAVPLFPPRLNRPDTRLQVVIGDTQARIALSTQEILAGVEQRIQQLPALAALRWLATDVPMQADATAWQPPAISGNTLAFLQYTSGSTMAPRGVQLTHGNLLHNLAAIRRCFAIAPHSQGLIWLPPYHDMGLIGGILEPLYSNIPTTLMSPTAFLERPLRWLQAISRMRATISGGPNFAYELCLRKISAEERTTLDLSCWEVAFNGAEPIRAATLERFTETFAPCGFRREAFYPCYGLAEATLIVAGGVAAAPPVIAHFATSQLQQNQIQPLPPDDSNGQALVSSGQPLSDQQLLIVHPETLTPCAPDQVGEIWISGPSVATGYWQQPAASAQTFGVYTSDGNGPFLRTGDLGFIQAGELFITGRLKELIIIRGRNYYPQDIEYSAGKSHSALRAGGGAAFSIDMDSEERLVIVHELDRQSRRADINEVAAAIRSAVAAAHDLQVHAVVLIKPGSLPKTSSGKVQRRLCRTQFLNNQLEVIGQSMPSAPSAKPAPQRANHFVVAALQAVSDPSARQKLITLYVQEQLAQLRGIAAAQIDPQQPLTSLGLDSLMAVEIKDHIETTFGVVLPLSTVLQGPNLNQLAALILGSASSSESAATGHAQLVPLNDAATRYALSASQRALWFLYRMAPDSAAYALSRALHIHGALDVAALQRAFQALILRHPLLRTTFGISTEGEAFQEIVAEATLDFTHTDASTWSKATVQEQLLAATRRHFDLEHGPVLRIALFTRTATEHILLINVHHIVMDFWSVSVLVRELQALYQQEVRGVAAALPDLPLHYRDYVHWQTTLLQGGRGAELWAYWQRQLAGSLPLLQLSSDQPQPAPPVRSEATCFFQLPAELTKQLRALARSESATLYMTLLAAFKVLLYRYTGQEDILVGSATAGRERAALRNLIGYFVNPVVMRTQLSGELPFTSLLARVRQTVLEAFAHQEYPFIDLVARIQPKREPNRLPLFQVMFTFQQAPDRSSEQLHALALGQAGAALDWGDIRLESMAVADNLALLDLQLVMAEVNDTLTGTFQYDTSLFSATLMSRMVGHFQQLLTAIVAAPQQPLAQLNLLSHAERHQLLDAWNTTQADYPLLPAHALIEAQVADHAERVAVRQGSSTLSYAELNRRANQLAHYLRKRGVGPEVAVGLYLERSIDLMVAILAVLKAGGFYVPLDPLYPAERRAFILQDAQVRILLTGANAEIAGEDSSDAAYLRIVLPAIAAELAQEPAHNPPCIVSAENLAYLIYTSGSTGQPKGAMITQRGLVNYLSWCQRAYPLQVGCEVPVHSSIAFDLTVTSTLAPLIAGTTVLMLPEDASVDALADTLRSDVDISLIKITPAHLKLLGEQLAATRLRARIHSLIIGGEPLLPDQIAFWQANSPTTMLINEYGPTETVVGCCVYTVPNDQSSQQTIPIGRPIQNTQLYILDQAMQPVPIGVSGELYIGGVGVARGYCKRPDLSAERFVPDPFGTAAGARLYKTGDLARYRADGSIECLGRVDTQVKLRGFRVEPGEIEAMLTQHPAIKQAAVIARATDAGEKRLLAYLVLAHDAYAQHETFSALSSTLRAFLKARLPAYMIPPAFVELPALPLMTNGKIDRRALAQITPPEHSASPLPDTAAYSPTERTLLQIWQHLLATERIGLHDNFFDLGGHSFLIFQLQQQIRAQLKCEVPITDFLSRPTISTLASYIDQQQTDMPQFAGQQSQARAETRLQALQLRRQARQERK